MGAFELGPVKAEEYVRTASFTAQIKESFNTQTYLKYSVPTSEAPTLASETDDLFNFVPLYVILS